MNPTPDFPTNPPPSILLVEDEPIVLNTLKSTLEREGFHIVACASPLKALAILEDREFSVIMSDQRMPEMMGLDFLIESRRLRPNSSRILLTAVLNLPTVIDAINKGEIYRFVAKPWLREELIATVRNAIQRNWLIKHNDALQAEMGRLNDELRTANQTLEARVADLEAQRKALDAANGELSARFDSSLELCRRILTAYDPILGSQTKALVEFAVKMAETEHFTDQERHALKSAAWLCDLGLIGVPRELLRSFQASRLDHLSDRERSMFYHHPIYSQTLAALVDPAPEVGEAIRGHHERYDGAGFPDGLVGKDIPWTARCLAVATGFVGSGLTKAQATEMTLSRAGTHYDPEAVRLFLKITHLVNLPRNVNEVMLEELEPGMMLATGIYSPHGLLLVGEGQTLGSAMIAKIRSHNDVTPINQRLLVYT